MRARLGPWVGHAAALAAVLQASATTAGTLGPVAELGISLVDVPDPVLHGAALSYVAILTNAGPSDATGASSPSTASSGESSA